MKLLCLTALLASAAAFTQSGGAFTTQSHSVGDRSINTPTNGITHRTRKATIVMDGKANGACYSKKVSFFSFFYRRVRVEMNTSTTTRIRTQISAIKFGISIESLDLVVFVSISWRTDASFSDVGQEFSIWSFIHILHAKRMCVWMWCDEIGFFNLINFGRKWGEFSFYKFSEGRSHIELDSFASTKVKSIRFVQPLVLLKRGSQTRCWVWIYHSIEWHVMNNIENMFFHSFFSNKSYLF